MSAPASLMREITALGIVSRDANWSPQKGGRTNRVWSIKPVRGGQDGALICKLYGKPDDNPLYPNLAGAEYEVLKALHRQALAPKPIALLNTKLGEALVYQRLKGKTWTKTPSRVAVMLGKLHDLNLTIPLRRLDTGSGALITQINNILASLRQPLPELPANLAVDLVEPLARPSLVHTDIVANNIVVTPDGLRLIDWQCPAYGDPCEDLASFLSPAMQQLYTGAPLSCVQRKAFLDAYPNRDITTRYHQLAPLLHWRIAAYCNWKVERGDNAYRAAMALELVALKAACGDHE